MRLKLSRQGRRSLKAGLDGESLEMTLLMDVMKHVDEDISEENLCDVLDTLVASCGSIENAIVALKTGKRRIENIAIYDLPDSINAAYAEFNEQSFDDEVFDDEAFNRCVRHLKRLLLIARDQVPDQESWEAWLAKNCPDISPRRAADIIKNWA